MSEKGGYNVNEKTDPTQNTIRLMDMAVNGLTALFTSEMHRVVEKIRQRYSIDDELKLLRDATDVEAPGCNAYVKQCRAWGQAEKAKIGLGG